MMEKLIILLLICVLVSFCSGEDTIPFVAWSNQKGVLDDIPATDSIDYITESLIPNINSVDTVIVFAVDELSFDSFNKHAGVYDSEISPELNKLKTAIKMAESLYWTGISSSSGDWLVKLAKGLNKYIHYIDENSGLLRRNDFLVKEIKNSDGWIHQDKIIGDLSEHMQSGSFLAIYTQLKHSYRSRRDVSNDFIVKRQSSESLGAAAASTTNSSCSVMGAFEVNVSSIPDPCLLFCVGDIMISNNEFYNCTFSKPASVSWCCTNTNDSSIVHCTNGSDIYISNDDYPSVTLKYTTDEKVCNGSFFNTPGFAFIRFKFPTVGNTSEWTMKLDVLNFGGRNYTDLERSHDEKKLYEKFALNFGLSYACAAHEYSQYTNSNGTESNDSSIHVTLKKIQVQPYKVKTSTFSSVYQCEGYFTPTTWMGILSVIILLLILYVSILCTFSMKTIDKFEDPRGQSISVEKLH